MIAQAESLFTPVQEQAEAKIQARLATFLALKSRLLEIRTRTKNPGIKTTADSLYKQQITTEAVVKDGLAAIEEIKVHGAAGGPIGRVLSATAAMEYQIRRVESLDRKFLKEQGIAVQTDWQFWARAGILVLGVAFMFRRRR